MEFTDEKKNLKGKILPTSKIGTKTP